MAKYYVYDSDLNSIANKLREISESTNTLKWTSGFLSEIETIKTKFNEQKQKAQTYKTSSDTYQAQAKSYQEQASTYKTQAEEYKKLYEEASNAAIVGTSDVYTYTGTQTYGLNAMGFFEQIEKEVKRTELGLSSTSSITYTDSEYVAYVSNQIALGNTSGQILFVPMINGEVQFCAYRYYDPSTATSTDYSSIRFGTGGTTNSSKTYLIHPNDTYFRVVLKKNEN